MSSHGRIVIRIKPLYNGSNNTCLEYIYDIIDDTFLKKCWDALNNNTNKVIFPGGMAESIFSNLFFTQKKDLEKYINYDYDTVFYVPYVHNILNNKNLTEHEITTRKIHGIHKNNFIQTPGEAINTPIWPIHMKIFDEIFEQGIDNYLILINRILLKNNIKFVNKYEAGIYKYKYEKYKKKYDQLMIKPRSITMTVRVIRGNDYIVKFDDNISFDEFTDLIQEVTGVEKNNQMLLYTSKIIKDESMFDEIKINFSKEDDITLVDRSKKK